MSKLVYGYARVSTEKQVTSGTSMEGQEAAIRAYFDYKLKAEGYEMGGWFRDPATSASIPLRNREQGFNLNNILEPGDCVVFAKLDRGFRNCRDMLATMESWQERGVNMHILDYMVDTSTAVGKMMVTFAAAMAEFERRNIRERTMAGTARKKAMGYYVHGSPPYGFVPTGPKGARTFQRCPAQRKVGKRLLELHEQGMSIDQLRWMLAREHFTWRGKALGNDAIKRWIQAERKLQEKEAAQTQTNGAPPGG